MKTAQPSFPMLQNEFLQNMLRQLVSKYAIVQVFYHKPTAGSEARLLIHFDKKTDADTLQSARWATKAMALHGTQVHGTYSTRLHHQHGLGHPFFAAYCRPSALIYENEAAGRPLHIKKGWGKYRDKFKSFRERLDAERERQREGIQILVSENASNSVVTAYQRLLEFDLHCLAELHTGNRLAATGLDAQVNSLLPYVPEIAKYFVKKSANTYFFTELFARAEKAIGQEDTMYNTELFDAIGITEKGLYSLVGARFAALKKQVKKAPCEKHQISVVPAEPKDETLASAIATVSGTAAVEEIYCYHEADFGGQKTYYLLIIANGLGNDRLAALTQSVKDRAVGQYRIMLISHSRYWIQKHLFVYQPFFARIIQTPNLVYASDGCHPALHWEVPHQPYHADLYFYYRATNQAAAQMTVVTAREIENYQGLAYLFTLFFLSFCRTYIFIKTYYLPNDLSALALWQLCLYADPGLQKFEPLFGRFPAPFFPYLDKHTALRRLSNTTEREAGEMAVITSKLMEALDSLVVEAGLSEAVAL